MKKLCSHAGFEIIYDDIYREECPHCNLVMENIRLLGVMQKLAEFRDYKYKCKCGIHDLIVDDQCEVCGEPYTKEYIE